MSQASTAINTYSGGVLDFADPKPEQINIRDIAHGLSMAPRFGGQALQFLSVAEHALNVSLLVDCIGHPELELAALHHDSHEAYACDIPRPLKALLGEAYEAVTGRLDTAIAKAFGFEQPHSTAKNVIKAVDDAVFVVEAADLLAGEPAVSAVDPELLKQAQRVVGTGNPASQETAAFNFQQAHDLLVTP